MHILITNNVNLGNYHGRLRDKKNTGGIWFLRNNTRLFVCIYLSCIVNSNDLRQFRKRMNTVIPVILAFDAVAS